ncbi:MAG: hypothetical protein V4654_09125 [Bdellovibrionota bacterium]
MRITPAPDQLNRALVGRVEVMNSVRFEESYALIRQLAVSNTPHAKQVLKSVHRLAGFDFAAANTSLNNSI